jgi:hypothetical protein
MVGVVQCTRIALWHQSQKALEGKAEDKVEEVVVKS